VKQREERSYIKAIVTGPDFVDCLKKSIALLKPIDRLIVKYQSDAVPVSEVLVDFGELIQNLSKLFDSEIITYEEKTYLRQLCKQRYEFLYGESHGLAYLLDPRFIGEKLNFEKKTELENILFSFPLPETNSCPADDLKIKIFDQYTQFFISAQNEKA